ncbi:unnamed protein product [Closterium sp. NIES-65]|nr:unnamed protein product [Closterium sp. NIES-65]
MAAKDGSFHFLLLKDRKTCYVWVRPVTKNSNVLEVFKQWLLVVERQTKKSVMMLRFDHGGEFLGKDFVGKGIVHDLTCPYTPQQNGMAEREMRMVFEAVRMMLRHMGVQHHWWHLALRHAVWVRNCLERSTLPQGTTPHQLLTGKKLDLTMARVWGCMVQFMGWEVLDLTDNKLVTTVETIFYETMSLEVWKVTHGPSSAHAQTHSSTDSSTATFSLLAKVDEAADEDSEDAYPSPPPIPTAPPLVANLPEPTPSSATGDEGSLLTLPMAPSSRVASGRRDVKLVNEGAKTTKGSCLQGSSPLTAMWWKSKQPSVRSDVPLVSTLASFARR